MSFNFMAAVTVHSDVGAQENKICCCFHFFVIYLLLTDETGCHDLCFLNVEFQISFFSITSWDIDLDYCDIECFALDTKRAHSAIFEIATKYCISDSC